MHPTIAPPLKADPRAFRPPCGTYKHASTWHPHTAPRGTNSTWHSLHVALTHASVLGVPRRDQGRRDQAGGALEDSWVLRARPLGGLQEGGRMLHTRCSRVILGGIVDRPIRAAAPALYMCYLITDAEG